jgi:hypothetical protein
VSLRETALPPEIPSSDTETEERAPELEPLVSEDETDGGGA